MDRREVERAVELRDAFRELLPHRGGRIGIAACGLAGTLLLSMLVRVVGAEPAVASISPRVASVAQRHVPALPNAPAVEGGRSNWKGSSR